MEVLKAISMADLATLRPRVTPGHVTHNAGYRYTYRPGINQYWHEPGWLADEMPGFDPATADICVHDILEHFPGDPASVVGEYMAQGAAVYTRAEQGYFVNQGALEDWVDSAFGTLFASILAAWHATEEPGPEIKGCVTHEAKILMEEMLHHARTVTTEQQLRIWQGEHRSPGTVIEALDALKVSVSVALPWMLEGYARAAKRFDGCGKGQRIAKIFHCATVQVAAIPWATDTHFTLSIDYAAHPSAIACTVHHP